MLFFFSRITSLPFDVIFHFEIGWETRCDKNEERMEDWQRFQGSEITSDTRKQTDRNGYL